MTSTPPPAPAAGKPPKLTEAQRRWLASHAAGGDLDARLADPKVVDECLGRGLAAITYYGYGITKTGRAALSGAGR